MLTLVTVERRAGKDRRQHPERRAGGRRGGQERRGEESAAEHIRNALQLIAEVADARELDDEHRRDLDAALFRLRFALDRLEAPVGLAMEPRLVHHERGFHEAEDVLPLEQVQKPRRKHHATVAAIAGARCAGA